MWSRAGEVSFQEIWRSRNPRGAARIPDSSCLSTKVGGSRGASQSQGRPLLTISVACLQCVVLRETSSPPKTTQQIISGAWQLFLPTCHWKTLTLNHTGKEIADFSPTMKTITQKGVEMMLGWHRQDRKFITPLSHIKTSKQQPPHHASAQHDARKHVLIAFKNHPGNHISSGIYITLVDPFKYSFI